MKSLIKVRLVSSRLVRLSTSSVLATGVLRFLLRDATGASAQIDDRIVQKLVENSENLHAGLKCQSNEGRGKELEESFIFFSRIAPSDFPAARRVQNARNRRDFSSKLGSADHHLDLGLVRSSVESRNRPERGVDRAEYRRDVGRW